MAQAVPQAYQVNGFASTHVPLDARAPSHEQIAFYEKVLQLREAVLSDRHALFKLPAAVRRQLESTAVAPSTTAHQLPDPATNQKNGTSAASGTQYSLWPQYNSSSSTGAQNAAAFGDNRTAHATQVSASNASPSGINPVLLTKSDDLIRAETHLKRQRIEKQLKENRPKILRSVDDGFPATLVDLPEILQKAWDIVKPVSGLKPTRTAPVAANDSFDENSYYSSQANDWSSEASADSRRNEVVVASAPVTSAAPQSMPGLASNAASLSKHSVSANEPPLDPQSSQPRAPMLATPDASFYNNDTEGAYDAEREDSEEYSPPEADAFSGPDGADADMMDLDDDSSEFIPEEPLASKQQAPVIASQLTNIAAPQPARVVKVAGLGQSTPQAGSVQGSRTFDKAMSEESTTSPLNSGHPTPNAFLATKKGEKHGQKNARTKEGRKKRVKATTAQGKRPRQEAALAKKAQEARGNVQSHNHAQDTGTHNRPQMAPVKQNVPSIQHAPAVQHAPATHHAPASPEPYIKPEPVSPPPFSNSPGLHVAKNRGPQNLPADVEIVSPHEFRPRPRQQYYQEPLGPPPPPQTYQYASPSSSAVRVASPAGYGRPRRDDQDLRRVASLHHAQRPVSPVYSPGGPYRTASHSQVYTEYAPSPSAGYRTEPMRASSRFVRSERSLSPPRVREVRDGYGSRLQSPTMAPPPPPPPVRKIVVDQYGNRYMAAEEAAPAPVSTRMSVVPRARYEMEPAPISTRMSVVPQGHYEIEPSLERAPSRASAMYAYAPPPGHNPYGETSMPPPGMRRVILQPESEAVDHRAYRQREYSRAPEPQYYREDVAYMAPPPPSASRGSVYAADHGAPPNYVRAYSVRPDAEPVRYMSRAPSVMPPPMAESGGLAPRGSTRAISVAPGVEYGREGEARYQYAQAAPYAQGAQYAMAPPQRRVEMYVDEYGREIRRASGYQ